MPISLIDRYREQIFGLLDSIVVRNNYKYLVLDDYTAELINKVATNLELLKHNVSAVERIEERRQSRGSFEAVYILSPRPHIVDCLISDYSRTPPRYGAAHVFFVPMLGEREQRRLYDSPAARFMGGYCNPLLIDYMPQQSQVYTFGEPDAMVTYYNRDCYNLVEKEVTRTSRRLVSLCATLGEYPIIRFYNPLEPRHEAAALPYMVASRFQKELDQYARANRNFPSTEPDRPQSVFLILDRSIDTKGPFVHELTYETMARDLLTIDDDKYSFEVPHKDNGGAPGTPAPPGAEQDVVEGVLTDEDPIWVTLRHKYIADAIEGVYNLVQEFMKNNSSFANIDQASMSQLKDVMLTMKVVTKEKDRLSLHSNMTETITELFHKTGVDTIVDVEQSLATGTTEEGKFPKHVLQDMVPLLDNDKVSPRDRIRLLGLYLLFREGIIEADFQKLSHHAKLNTPDMQVLRNMDLLGAKIFKESLREKARPPKTKLPPPRELKEGETVEISRYVSPLKEILQDVVNNSLDLQTFPYSKDQPETAFESITPVPTSNTSTTSTTRRNKATWHDGPSSHRAPPAQRIFIFVAGGITYAEARVAYEISEAHGKEVIIGAEDFLTPAEWLRQLYRLRLPREVLKLAADKPEPKVPAHLLEPDPPPATHIGSTAAAGKSSKPSAQAAASSPAAHVPATAPHKLSRNPEHHQHKSGNPPGHFDAIDTKKKKGSKIGRFFK
ncbi:Sec1-like protein [Myxozyma melibiosi]|uniref:Sec1-like protein n=1 Tax=Myxozyma melibiosi TaxID=54550 RepID=A0ABR1EY83_9ASCO